MTFETINDAYLFALSAEGRAEVAGEEAGSFLVTSWSLTQNAYRTMRAAILAELATLDADELEDGARRMSVNGVRFSNRHRERFAAIASRNDSYLHVGQDGALELLNEKVGFSEGSAFGWHVDFIRPEIY